MEPQLDIGKRQFHVGMCLGRGGFGEVYRARMVSAAGLETEVAIKVLRDNLDPAGQAVQRLRDEARLLARLDHPTILRVIDLVVLEGYVSLVTELIEGADLGECLVGADPMPLKSQLEVIGAVAGALEAAFAATGADGRRLELVHRDIKPPNIRISRRGQVKLLDFGIARSDGMEREAHTQTDLMIGSPFYMAPERFMATAARPESDVFALGCCLYEGIAGGNRFFGTMTVPVLAGTCVDATRFGNWLDKQLKKLGDAPAGVLALLRDLLAFEADERPSAAEVVRRCEALSDVATGLSLPRWARDHSWADAPDKKGPLGGRMITEGTLVKTAIGAGREPPPEPVTASTQLVRRHALAEEESVTLPAGPAHRRWGLWLGVGVVLGVTLLGIVGGGLATGGLVATGLMVGTSAPPTVEASAVPPPVVIAPTAEVEPAPAPAPAAIVPSTVPPARVEPPAAVVGKPAGKPADKPADKSADPVRVTPRPSASALVHVGFKASGTVTAELVRDGKRYPLPADVPAGDYRVSATFGTGAPVDMPAAVHVGAGSAMTVSCNERVQRCTAN